MQSTLVTALVERNRLAQRPHSPGSVRLGKEYAELVTSQAKQVVDRADATLQACPDRRHRRIRAPSFGHGCNVGGKRQEIIHGDARTTFWGRMESVPPNQRLFRSDKFVVRQSPNEVLAPRLSWLMAKPLVLQAY